MIGIIKPKAFRLWVLWLVLSLILSQSLGQLHAVKHAGKLGVQTTTVHAAGKQRAGGIYDLLFSSHSSASDCRLYDHLSHGQAMPHVLALPLPVVLPSLLVAIFAGDALARWVALFDARGPPLTS